MFQFTKKPSSGSHSQYLTKITSLVQCGYRRRTDVVSVMTAYYAPITLTTSVRRLYRHWTKPVFLAKYWLSLPDDGFLVNRNMLEQNS
jgi:hypothetical protein